MTKEEFIQRWFTHVPSTPHKEDDKNLMLKDLEELIRQGGQIEPLVSLPKPEILLLFRKLYSTDRPEYVGCYIDYDLAYTDMIKMNQADPQRNYFIESVTPKARSN